MAKDDYDVIVYKILLYFYGCLKRTIRFERIVFFKAIDKDNLNEEYLTDILLMMQDSGLIRGVETVNAWGRDSILISDYKDIRITPEGIGYLHDNSRMEKAKKAIQEMLDITASLIDLLKL